MQTARLIVPGEIQGTVVLEYAIVVRSLRAIDRAIGTGALETCRLIRKKQTVLLGKIKDG